jgi:hypothetical protein
VVRLREGEPIAGTAVRCVIRSDRTGGFFSVRTGGFFSVPTGELARCSLVVPHTRVREHELSFVRQGRIGARVGDRDVTVDVGGFLLQPRGVLQPSGTRRMNRRSP